VIGSIRKDEQAEENSIKKVFCRLLVEYYPGNFDNSIYYSRTIKDIYADVDIFIIKTVNAMVFLLPGLQNRAMVS
jgi:hypothetical protein